MPEKIIVEMDEFKCTTDSNFQLVTYGISSCIAFVVLGIYTDEEEDQTPFCALYHWPGFEEKESDPEGRTEALLIQFLNTIRYNLELSKLDSVSIHSFSLIGGEKRQIDDLGNLLLSGTEAEVEALKSTVERFDFREHYFILSQDALKFHHYLTKNTDTIDVALNINSCIFRINSTKHITPCSELPSTQPKP